MPDSVPAVGADVIAAGALRPWQASLDPEIRTAIQHLARDVEPMKNLAGLLFVAVWIGAGALVLAYPIWIVRLPCYLAMGASLNGLGALMHEAVHGNLFRRRPTDRLAAFLLGAPFLVSGAAYRVSHLLHHRFNRSVRDPDDLFNYSENRRVLALVFYAWTLLGIVAFLIHVPVNALRHGTPPERREVIAEYSLLLALYGAITILATHFRATGVLAHVWLVPLAVNFLIVNLRGWSEHLLTVPGHPLTQTRTITSNAVVRFFFCNVNYHLEHHLFPAVPWYHLPRVHRLLQEEFTRAGAFIYRSYARVVWDALRAGVHGLAPARRFATVPAQSGAASRPPELAGKHPGPSPYALLAYVPVIAGGAVWSAARVNVGWGRAAGLAVAGLALWSMLEYLIHRYILHIVPHAPWLLERQQHLQHHATPVEPAFQVAPLYFSVGIGVILAVLLRGLLGTWPPAILIVCGISTGYVIYELLHYWIHVGGRGGRIMGRLRRHHFYHHYRDDHRCFGVTTPFWDWVFRTARPDRGMPAIPGSDQAEQGAPGKPRPTMAARTIARAIRAARYLQVMFPPASLVPMGAATFLSIYLALQALAGLAPLRFGWPAVVGAVTTVLWMLLVRLQDDIADADLDIRLAESGDPRYRGRPIVTGGITVPELHALRAGALALLLGLNATLGLAPATDVALLVGLMFTWLGFQWFFIPALRANPTPVAYLARKTLTVLPGIYAAALVVDQFRPVTLSPWIAAVLVVPALEVAAWEVGRKIRVPQDETEYGTYSKALGWRGAALLTTAFVFLALVGLLAMGMVLDLGASFVAAVSIAGLFAMGAALRFWVTPTRQHARLQPVMELFGAVAHGAVLIALLLRNGGLWS